MGVVAVPNGVARAEYCALVEEVECAPLCFDCATVFAEAIGLDTSLCAIGAVSPGGESGAVSRAVDTRHIV